MFGPINTFRQRLRQGEKLLGAGISLSDSQASEALADSVDFLWIELEHTGMSEEALRGHLLAARARQKPALVRVPQGITPFIKPVLDSGATGIIAPQILTVQEVRDFVADCRYPPRGRRGYGPMVPSNYGRDGGKAYVDRADQGVFAVAMVETREAVEAIDEIVRVPTLDSIVIGPWDLSGSLGRLGDVEHPEVVGAIDKVIESARKADVFVGSGAGLDPEYGARLFARGVQWVQLGGDLGYMVHAAERVVAAVRERLKK